MELLKQELDLINKNKEKEMVKSINEINNTIADSFDSIFCLSAEDYKSLSKSSGSMDDDDLIDELSEDIKSSDEPESVENLYDELTKITKSNDINCEKCNMNYTLECEHIICIKCNKLNIVDGNLIIICAICNKSSNINLNNIITFFTDITQLTEFLNGVSYNKPKNIICENCNLENAEIGCFECEVKLCHNCWPQIHRIGKLTQHKAVNLEEYDDNPICINHPKYYKELICTENKLLCMMCERTSQNTNINTKLISNVAVDHRNNLQSELHNIKEINKQIHDILIHLNSEYDDNLIQKFKGEALDNIHMHFENIRKRIDFYESVTADKVNVLIHKQATNLLTQRKELCDYLTSSMELCNKINNHTENAGDFSIVKHYTEQFIRLNNLKNQKINLEKNVIKPVNVSFEYENMFNSIQVDLYIN